MINFLVIIQQLMSININNHFNKNKINLLILSNNIKLQKKYYHNKIYNNIFQKLNSFLYNRIK